MTGSANAVAGLMSMQPVVGREIGTPGHQRSIGEIVLDRVAAQKPKDAEEGRYGVAVAKRGSDR